MSGFIHSNEISGLCRIEEKRTKVKKSSLAVKHQSQLIKSESSLSRYEQLHVYTINMLPLWSEYNLNSVLRLHSFGGCEINAKIISCDKKIYRLKVEESMNPTVFFFFRRNALWGLKLAEGF